MRLLVFGFILSFALIAQSSQGDYSISGVVVNSLTGEPVKSAMVTLLEWPNNDAAGGADQIGQAPKTRTTMAGVGGEFQFAGLAKGQYLINAQKPGLVPYQDTAHIETGSVKLSSSLTGLRIRLAPLGVIAGKLADQYGEPVRDVTVALLTSDVQDGVRTTLSNRTVATNDRGEFRLWDLPPGTYYIKAMGRAGGTSEYIGDNIGANCACSNSWEGLRPVYFGGARSSDSAAAIVMTAGTEARADLSLVMEPSFKIRGTVENFRPLQTVTFKLFENDEDVAPSRVFLNGTTGKFELADVVSGQYTLRVTQGRSARGEIAVNVKSGDVNGVSVALAPAVTVRGLIHVIGAVPEQRKKAAGDDEGEPVDRPSCAVFLDPVGRAPDSRSPLLGRMEDKHEFTIADVFAGEYRVRMDCGGYVVSALSGGLDLLANPRITIQPGVIPAPIEISLNPGGGTLKGKLAVRPAPPRAGVLLVPAFSASTGPVVAFLQRDPESQDAPEFELSHLAPGDYLVYAFSDLRAVEFRKPAFLQALTGGMSVRIENGKTAEITLTSVVK